MPKISKRSIDELIASGAPGDVIRDDGVKGFNARLNKDRSVSYRVEYRAGRGRGFPVKRLRFGRHSQLTPDRARSLAKKMLASVVSGGDPAEERGVRKREMTVAQFLRDAIESRWKAARNAGTPKNFEGMIERTLFPEFGAKRGFRNLPERKSALGTRSNLIGHGKPISTWRSCARRLTSRSATR